MCVILIFLYYILGLRRFSYVGKGICKVDQEILRGQGMPDCKERCLKNDQCTFLSYTSKHQLCMHFKGRDCELSPPDLLTASKKGLLKFIYLHAYPGKQKTIKQ